MLNGTALDKWMWRIAYLYLIIPFIIFCFGWLRWYYSIPVIFAVITAGYLSIRRHSDPIHISFSKYKRTVWICFAILVLWVLFSGIGQFSYQNSDHYARNAVLQDLVQQPWPLVYDFTKWQPYGVTEPGSYMLVYYIGYWMPAALFGKLFGLQAAHFFLFLWTVLGVTLVFYFICRHLKRISFWLLALCMLFGGMDVIPFLIQGNYHPLLHLEWWHNGYQQYTSNTSLLYWVFNQAIAPWLIIGMFFNRVPNQNMAFLCALCFFYAPFPFLGLIPFAIYFFFTAGKPGLRIKEIFSFQNTPAAMLILLVTFGFFSAISTEKSFNLALRPFTDNLVFYVIEFLVLAIIVLITGTRKLLVLIIISSLVLLSFIQYRHTPDLMMRASIPALFVLMVLTAEQLVKKRQGYLGYVLVILVLVGSVTSLNEIMRSVYYTGKYHYIKHVQNERPGFSLLQKPGLFKGRNPVIITMIGNTNAFFCRVLCKKKR
jgi:hypothetical protein